jgi:hypothetical protein
MISCFQIDMVINGFPAGSSEDIQHEAISVGKTPAVLPDGRPPVGAVSGLVSCSSDIQLLPSGSDVNGKNRLQVELC